MTTNEPLKSRRVRPGGPDPRAGFALPAAILALAVVAILIAGGFHMANQEQQVGMSSERATQAFYLAEDGLSRVVSQHRQMPSGFWPGGSWDFGTPMVYDGPRGTTTVRAQRANADGLYYVQSVSEIDYGRATARSALGLVVRRGTADFEVDAALTTQGQVRLRGSAEIHGEDTMPPTWGNLEDCEVGDARPGVVVGEGGDVDVGGSAEITGDPPYTEDESIGDHTFQEFGGMTWDQLTSQADITFPGGTSINNMEASLDGDGNCDYSDPFNWGYPYDKDDPDHMYAPCHDYFPIIHVQGDLTIQSNGYGQGILLVDGDADLRGGFDFFGIVIVQGQLQTQGGGGATGAPRIYGGAMARNADLEQQSYVGASVIQYSSCVVGETIRNAQGLNWILPLAERSFVGMVGL
jgi:hypothetical protein